MDSWLQCEEHIVIEHEPSGALPLLRLGCQAVEIRVDVRPPVEANSTFRERPTVGRGILSSSSGSLPKG
jgi:hypothetical protein